ALLAAIPQSARVLCAGIEGVDPERAHFKLYWRLAEVVPLAAFGDPLFADPAFARFARLAVGERTLPARAIVASAGFTLGGEPAGVKLDLCTCSGCAARAGTQWHALLGQLEAELGVPIGRRAQALALGSPAFVGFGLSRDGRRRVNLYLTPERLP
ncbi:MAG TPA: hypothetical protein VMH02_09495, partial [Verrucomicrobiae bacterium]|nr:hypothetical protein [Verrucomicrobiae bacterium]